MYKKIVLEKCFRVHSSSTIIWMFDIWQKEYIGRSKYFIKHSKFARVFVIQCHLIPYLLMLCKIHVEINKNRRFTIDITFCILFFAFSHMVSFSFFPVLSFGFFCVFFNFFIFFLFYIFLFILNYLKICIRNQSSLCQTNQYKKNLTNNLCYLNICTRFKL